VDSLSYTSLGQPLQYTMGTSSEPVYITDSYDPQTGNLTQQDTQTGTADTSVDDLNYTYNDVGDVTSEADTPAGDPAATDVQCFQYDYLGRLVQAWAQGSTGCATTPSASAEGGPAPYWETYTYSVTGNLTGITSTTPAGAVTTTADTYPATGAAQPHAITGQVVTTPAGKTSSSYGYNADGDLTSVTGTTGDQALTWNDAGQLSQDAVTPAGGAAQDTDYIYDANGNLLLREDPSATTLILGDEELVLNASTGAVTGTRFYTIGSTIVAARTGTGALAYLAGDQQGTEEVAIDSAALAVTRRYYDPYGNTLGAAPASWPGQKGFAGGTTDPSASVGLTDLGAREYQAATGSFISPDQVRNAYDPQDLNPYAYSYDDPATFSDPTGQTASTSDSSTANSSSSSKPPTVTLQGGCLVIGGKKTSYCLPNLALCPPFGGVPPSLQQVFSKFANEITQKLEQIGWQGIVSVIGFSICLFADALECMLVSDAGNTITSVVKVIQTKDLTKGDVIAALVQLSSDFAVNAAGAGIGDFADAIYDNTRTALEPFIGQSMDNPVYQKTFDYIVGQLFGNATCNGEVNVIDVCESPGPGSG
jgi:RHS repeat-associated protein